VDYLLKPYSNHRFREALERAKAQMAHQSGGGFQTRLAGLLCDSSPAVVPSPDGRRFMIKTPEKTSFAEPDDIIWSEAADHYVLVHTKERSHIVRESVATLEKLLDPAVFLRTHRSAIVNTGHIKELRPGSRDERDLLLTGGKSLRVSCRRLRTLLDHLGL
jgi:two-component system LytT family response regulator